jgi:hypothetical protein
MLTSETSRMVWRLQLKQVRQRRFPTMLLLALLLSVFGLSGFAAVARAGLTTARVSITPPLYVAQGVGEYYSFYVNIYNVQNLKTSGFTIVYNASVLQFSQAVQMSFFPSPPASSFQYQADGSLGTLKVNLSLASSQPPLSGNGTLFRVTLKVVQKPTSCTVSTIVFSQVSLLDSSGNPISSDCVGAVCFWGSIGPDPPGPGLLTEYTDKGGGWYTIGETVFLFSQVTYNGDPVRNKLVAFQILNPIDNTVTMSVAITDQNGIASTSFRVPEIGSSLGVWTAFSTVELDQILVFNVIHFQVLTLSPVGGFSFSPRVVVNVTNPLASYTVLLITFSTLAFIVCKPGNRRRRR